MRVLAGGFAAGAVQSITLAPRAAAAGAARLQPHRRRLALGVHQVHRRRLGRGATTRPSRPRALLARRLRLRLRRRSRRVLLAVELARPRPTLALAAAAAPPRRGLHRRLRRGRQRRLLGRRRPPSSAGAARPLPAPGRRRPLFERLRRRLGGGASAPLRRLGRRQLRTLRLRSRLGRRLGSWRRRPSCAFFVPECNEVCPQTIGDPQFAASRWLFFSSPRQLKCGAPGPYAAAQTASAILNGPRRVQYQGDTTSGELIRHLRPRTTRCHGEGSDNKLRAARLGRPPGCGAGEPARRVPPPLRGRWKQSRFDGGARTRGRRARRTPGSGRRARSTPGASRAPTPTRTRASGGGRNARRGQRDA